MTDDRDGAIAESREAYRLRPDLLDAENQLRRYLLGKHMYLYSVGMSTASVRVKDLNEALSVMQEMVRLWPNYEGYRRDVLKQKQEMRRLGVPETPEPLDLSQYETNPNQ
jgi:hypothetical protein